MRSVSTWLTLLAWIASDLQNTQRDYIVQLLSSTIMQSSRKYPFCFESAASHCRRPPLWCGSCCWWNCE
uniref:Putative secreted protein n=1 Tax=Anopheles triannulatus TaxID=58253 RepID=A0A2M4B5Q3_9DIPT